MAQTLSSLPIITFVGKKNSGKTTFLVKVVAELTRRGLKVATVKHHAHPSPIDGEGTDSARFGQAGACITMVSSSSQLGIVHAMKEEATMERIVQEACQADCDVLVAEGFKRLNYAKVELSRIERSDEPICAPHEIEALVTNNPALVEAYAPRVPVFALEDIDPFCDFLMSHWGLSARRDVADGSEPSGSNNPADGSEPSRSNGPADGSGLAGSNNPAGASGKGRAHE